MATQPCEPERARPRAQRKALLSALLLLLLSATGAAADLCTVPTSHATIQQALDQPLCTTILLAAGTYAESITIDRSVSLRGAASPPSILAGRVMVTGTGTVAALADLRVDTSTPGLAGCFPEAVVVGEGARLLGEHLDVRQADGPGGDCDPGGPLFSDGFESGTTEFWSATFP